MLNKEFRKKTLFSKLQTSIYNYNNYPSVNKQAVFPTFLSLMKLAKCFFCSCTEQNTTATKEKGEGKRNLMSSAFVSLITNEKA